MKNELEIAWKINTDRWKLLEKQESKYMLTCLKI